MSIQRFRTRCALGSSGSRRFFRKAVPWHRRDTMRLVFPNRTRGGSAARKAEASAPPRNVLRFMMCMQPSVVDGHALEVAVEAVADGAVHVSQRAGEVQDRVARKQSNLDVVAAAFREVLGTKTIIEDV